MTVRSTVALSFLTLVMVAAFAQNPAFAHSFNVALVVEPSSLSSGQGRQIYEGFLLATEERDGHPGEQSDGHLGGLDVYVTVIDGQPDFVVQIEKLMERGGVDIVAAFVPEPELALIRKLLEGKEVALLLPGRTPFFESSLSAVAAFVSAYQSKYGVSPSPQAAQGYNAARRIDAAVRAQGGVAVTALLLRVFGETEQNFDW